MVNIKPSYPTLNISIRTRVIGKLSNETKINNLILYLSTKKTMEQIRIPFSKQFQA